MTDNKIKIFLGNKEIEFISNEPEEKSIKELIIRCESRKQVVSAYQKFNSDVSVDRLRIWSPFGTEENKRIFFSLFKIIEAAGGIVRKENRDMLVIFRYGKWDLPKGKIKKNDLNREEAALREVREETGLRRLRITRTLWPTYHIYTFNETHILKPTYWFEMYGDGDETLTPQPEEDISVVKWLPWNDINLLVSNTYASLRCLILQYQRLE